MASRPMPTSKSSYSSTSSSKGGSRRHERSLSETRSAPYRVFKISQNKPHLAGESSVWLENWNEWKISWKRGSVTRLLLRFRVLFWRFAFSLLLSIIFLSFFGDQLLLYWSLIFTDCINIFRSFIRQIQIRIKALLPIIIRLRARQEKQNNPSTRWLISLGNLILHWVCFKDYVWLILLVGIGSQRDLL